MDVTERKTREETIREQEAELRQILDLTPQLIAVYGANRERLYINRIALDYLGLSLEEWRQTREWGAFVHPDDRARERDYFDRALSTGSAYELELRLRKADGSYRWFLARSNPFRDDKYRMLPVRSPYFSLHLNTHWFCSLGNRCLTFFVLNSS
jgi:PAS domain S-box-containing protein